MAITGGEGYAAAIGLAPDMVEGYLESQLKETLCMERMVGGALNIKSEASWMPASGVMVLKPGEEFCIDSPDYGKSKVTQQSNFDLLCSSIHLKDIIIIHSGNWI